MARDCRIYIYNLALRLGVPVKGAGLPEGIEIFPKQDELRRGELRKYYQTRGPLGIHRGAGRRFWFYGANYTLEEQMAYLKRLRKVTGNRARTVYRRQVNAIRSHAGPPVLYDGC